MDINSALNIVQFVEIYEKIWYNKVSETNTFEQQINNQKVD